LEGEIVVVVVVGGVGANAALYPRNKNTKKWRRDGGQRIGAKAAA